MKCVLKDDLMGIHVVYEIDSPNTNFMRTWWYKPSKTERFISGVATLSQFCGDPCHSADL